MKLGVMAGQLRVINTYVLLSNRGKRCEEGDSSGQLASFGDILYVSPLFAARA